MVGEVVRVTACYAGVLQPVSDSDVDDEATKRDDNETTCNKEDAEVDDSRAGPKAALQDLEHVHSLRELTESSIYAGRRVLWHGLVQGVERKLEGRKR